MSNLNNGDMPASPIRGADNTIFTSHDAGAIEGLGLLVGLTKREAFAMAAMQNILTQYNPYEQGDFDSSDYELTAKNAVGLADALLKELSND